MTPIPVTLTSAAACALLNGWLSARIGKLRGEYRVSVGDGGHEPLLRRMRAQANFTENAPFFLLLLLSVELSGAMKIGVAAIALLFLLARISHAIGMDGGDRQRWRMYGMMGSTFAMLALVLWALGIVVQWLLSR